MGRNLKGLVVVITGGSSGIGRAAAHRFAQEGCRLVLAARRPDALAETARECAALGGEALAVPTDVSNAGEVDALAKATIEQFGRIDIWVNCAAVLQYGRLEETPPEVLQRVIQTNLFGQFHGAQAAIRHFREHGDGILINTGSVLGLMGHAYTAAYVASKFAILGLTSSLREEVKDAPGIQVCEVLPAAMDTPIYRRCANFTRHKVTPMRPIYPPERAAAQIVSLARRPRRRAYAGGVGRIVAVAHNLAPKASEQGARLVANSMEISDEAAADTPGNLFVPVSDAWRIDGGWRQAFRRDGEASRRTLTKSSSGPLLIGAAAVAVLAMAVYRFGSRQTDGGVGA